jgi:hypothetical protein
MAGNADGHWPGTTHAITILGESARRRMCELCADGEQAVVSTRIVVQKEFGISQRVAICGEYWAVGVEGDRTRSVIVVGTPRFGATRRIAHITNREQDFGDEKGQMLLASIAKNQKLLPFLRRFCPHLRRPVSC